MPHTMHMRNYRSLFGWGISIYAIGHTVWTGFVSYQFTDGTAPHIIMLMILAVLAAIAGDSLHLSTWKDMLPYSITWGLCMAVLNTLLSWPFIAWGVFVEPYVWTSYAVVIVVPLFFTKRISSAGDVPRWHT
jgi:hypothetical protein